MCYVLCCLRELEGRAQGHQLVDTMRPKPQPPDTKAVGSQLSVAFLAVTQTRSYY